MRCSVSQAQNLNSVIVIEGFSALVRANEENRGEKLIFSVSPSQFAVNVKTDSKESASGLLIDRSVQHLDKRPF